MLEVGWGGESGSQAPGFLPHTLPLAPEAPHLGSVEQSSSSFSPSWPAKKEILFIWNLECPGNATPDAEQISTVHSLAWQAVPGSTA